MKTMYGERRLKRKALALARILEYTSVVRLKDWHGCPVFEPLFNNGSVKVGVPLMIIITKENSEGDRMGWFLTKRTVACDKQRGILSRKTAAYVRFGKARYLSEEETNEYLGSLYPELEAAG